MGFKIDYYYCYNAFSERNNDYFTRQSITVSDDESSLNERRSSRFDEMAMTSVNRIQRNVLLLLLWLTILDEEKSYDGQPVFLRVYSVNNKFVRK